MGDLTFQMLLHSHYTGDDNSVEQLHIEHLVDDNWQKLDLNFHSPGFDIFMYAILTCQHMFFRNNAAEYGMVLESSEGLLTIVANEHRSINSLHVDFKGQLKKGTPSREAVDSITARMKLCPVSINLKDIKDLQVTVSFDPA